MEMPNSQLRWAVIELLIACLSFATPAAGYSIVHNFAGGRSDGAMPLASLTWDGVDTFYGTLFEH